MTVNSAAINLIESLRASMLRWVLARGVTDELFTTLMIEDIEHLFSPRHRRAM